MILPVLGTILLANCAPPADIVPAPTERTSVKATQRPSSISAHYEQRHGAQLIITFPMDERWEVEEAADLWNEFLNCEYFYTEKESSVWDLPTQKITVRQVTVVSDVLGSYTDTYPVALLELNNVDPPNRKIVMHELGHALGIEDHLGPGTLMSPAADSEIPTIPEVALAQTLVYDECQDIREAG